VIAVDLRPTSKHSPRPRRPCRNRH
jgi:hypothetical protein